MDPDRDYTLTLQCSSDPSIGPREHLRSSLSPAITFWRTCLRVYLSRDVRCSLMQCGVDILREEKILYSWKLLSKNYWQVTSGSALLLWGNIFSNLIMCLTVFSKTWKNFTVLLLKAKCVFCFKEQWKLWTKTTEKS